jgi:hypothetical protein
MNRRAGRSESRSGQRKETRNASQIIRHGGERRNVAPKTRARSRLLRAWRAEDVGLVRRAWVFGNRRLFYGLLTHSRTARLPCDGRRILWRVGVDPGIPHTNCRFRNRSKYGGRHCDGAQQLRVLHELDRHTEGRRVRISPAGVGHHSVPHDSRRRRLFARSPGHDGPAKVQPSLAHS